MAKEIYLYSSIYDFTAQAVISSINDNMGENASMRVMSMGGSVFAAYGIFKKMREHGDITLKVDGAAMSAAALLPLYAKYTECLDISRFVFHRADMFVQDDEDQAFLDSINADLKAQMVSKLDETKFKKITGMSFDDMFNPDTRIDITISGIEAKKIGLVQKVNSLTPEMKKQITALNERFSIAANSTQTEKEKPTIMDLTKLKAEHPALYAQIIALGIEQGVAQEKARVEAVLEFSEVDAKLVKEVIASGKPLTAAQTNNLLLKSVSAEHLAKVKAGTTLEAIVTDETGANATQKEATLSAFEKLAKANSQPANTYFSGKVITNEDVK